jgi:molybdenum cofactor cytidylyltransferase
MEAEASAGPVVGLLLAAGESTRMGRSKPLLDWDGGKLIEYQIRELLAGGVDEVIVVLGHRADEVRPLVEGSGARWVLNSAYREGRAGSIRTGASAVPDNAVAVVVLNVDQPRSRSIVRAVLDGHLATGNVITTPAYAGRHGHPAVFAGELLPELRSVDEASEGLRAVNRRHADRRSEVAIDDPSVLLDLNLPTDYESAKSGADVNVSEK